MTDHTTHFQRGPGHQAIRFDRRPLPLIELRLRIQRKERMIATLPLGAEYRHEQAELAELKKQLQQCHYTQP